MRYVSFIFAVIAALLLGTNFILADQPIVGEGTEGIADLKGRNPVLSVSTDVTEGNVKILADAYTRDQQYVDYPIRFDFFINRKLHTSQIRTKSLPGPVGVDIGSDTATVPFNYSVLATIITPNRQFSSLVQGAVFEKSPAIPLDCSITIGRDDQPNLYVANGVETFQESIDIWNADFTATSTANNETVSVEVVIKTANLSATGTINIKQDSGSEKTDVTGTVDYQEGSIASLNLANSDGTVALSCS